MGPNPGTGWEVKVVSATDYSTVMARVSRWKNLTVSKVLSDVGGGVVDIPLDDPSITDALPPGISVTRDVAVLDTYVDDLARPDKLADYIGPEIVTNSQTQMVDLGSTTQYARIPWLDSYGAASNQRMYYWYEDSDNHIFVDTNRAGFNSYGAMYLKNAGVITEIGSFNNGFGGGPAYVAILYWNQVTNACKISFHPSRNGIGTFDSFNLTFTLGVGIWTGFTPGTQVGWDSSVASYAFPSSGGSGASINLDPDVLVSGFFNVSLLLYSKPYAQRDLGDFDALGETWNDLMDNGSTPRGVGMEIYDQSFVSAWNPWSAFDAFNGSGGYAVVDPGVADGAFQVQILNIDANVGLSSTGVHLRVNNSGQGITVYAAYHDVVFAVMPPGATYDNHLIGSGVYWAPGDLLKVVYTGNHYEVYQNSTSLGYFNVTGWSTTESRVGTYAGGEGETFNSTYETRDLNIATWIQRYGRAAFPTFIGSALIPVTVSPTNVLEDENLWNIYEDGSLKFQFLGELVEEIVVQEDQTKSVKVQGRGIGSVLEWGKVFPVGWPTVVKLEQEFVGKPAIFVWLTLLNQCKARGTLTFVSPSFTLTQDSAGAPWADLNNITVSPGEDLLGLLKRFCELIGADWQMQNGFVLDVRQSWGTHKEDTIVFWPADEQLEQGRVRDRQSIANVIAVKTGDKKAIYAEGLDTASAGRYQRRELYLEASDARGKPQGQVVAQTALRVNKAEIKSLTMKVVPDEAKAEMLVDYTIGDWVYVRTDDDYMSSAYRVASASVTINEEEEIEGELILETRRQLRIAQLMRQLANISSGGNGSTTPSKPKSAVAATEDIGLGDLVDVSTVGATTSTYLKWDGLKWRPALVTVAKSLASLTDVNLTSPADGAVLTYSSGASKWIDSLPSVITPGHVIRDEGTPLTQRAGLNFVGAGVSAVDNSGSNRTDVTISGKHVIHEETTPLAARAALAFVGTAVTVTDDSGGDRTVVTIVDSGPHQIVDETTNLPNRSKLAFQGAGVTATDDLGNNQTVVTVPDANHVPVAGTVGQVLTKTGVGDYAVSWQNATGGGASGVRTSQTYTTASLAAGGVETGVIVLSKGFRLIQLQTSAAARVRLYANVADRTTDAARPVGSDPSPGVGLILDYVTTASNGVSALAELSPVVDGANTESSPDGNIPLTITATGAGVIVLTLIYVPTEA